MRGVRVWAGEDEEQASASTSEAETTPHAVMHGDAWQHMGLTGTNDSGEGERAMTSGYE